MKNMPRVRPAERGAGTGAKSGRWKEEPDNALSENLYPRPRGYSCCCTLVLGGEPGRAVAQASRPGPGESPLLWPLPPPSCSTQPVCERWLVPIL